MLSLHSRRFVASLLGSGLFVVFVASGTAQQTTTTAQAPQAPPAPVGYTDTPMQPNGK